MIGIDRANFQDALVCSLERAAAEQKAEEMRTGGMVRWVPRTNEQRRAIDGTSQFRHFDPGGGLA